MSEATWYVAVDGGGEVSSSESERVIASSGIGRGRKEEGSTLGPLGNLLDGDG
jgi:hypothetical protein